MVIANTTWSTSLGATHSRHSLPSSPSARRHGPTKLLQLTQHRCIDVQDATDTLVKGFQDARWDGRHETSDEHRGVRVPGSSRLMPALHQPALLAQALNRRPTCTTSGNQASATTCPRGPWPNANQPAILAVSPRSTAASRHRRSTSKPTTPRGAASTALLVEDEWMEQERNGERVNRAWRRCGLRPPRAPSRAP